MSTLVHFGTSADMSGQFGTGAEVSYGHFGTSPKCHGSKESWHRVLHRVSSASDQPLQNVLNAVAWIILRKWKFDHITTNVRDRLHWLPIQQRIEYKVCVLVHKCLHQAAPTYLAELYAFHLRSTLLIHEQQHVFLLSCQYDLLFSLAKINHSAWKLCMSAFSCYLKYG